MIADIVRGRLRIIPVKPLLRYPHHQQLGGGATPIINSWAVDHTIIEKPLKTWGKSKILEAMLQKP